MPAAFAHDLYGRKVYMEADPVIKRIIKKERYCFLLGLHGPDILFFYKALGKNKVNRKACECTANPLQSSWNVERCWYVRPRQRTRETR